MYFVFVYIIHNESMGLWFLVYRKEMEKQRMEEWEKQRRNELEQHRQRETEKVLMLRAKKETLATELENVVRR